VDSDLNLIPLELAQQSISRREIVLPLAAALRAVDHLEESGRRIEAWEGWVRLPDGSRAHSLRHPGSFALPYDCAEAARTVRRAITEAQGAWDRVPEYPGAALYFCLTLASA
jgi:hypothetical protein